MKKLHYILLMAFALTIGLCVSSCKGEDDSAVSAEKLIGKWELCDQHLLFTNLANGKTITMDGLDPEDDIITIEFKDNDLVVVGYIDSETGELWDEEDLAWSLDGNKLQVYDPYEPLDGEEIKITSLTADKLVFEAKMIDPQEGYKLEARVSFRKVRK